MSIRDYFDIDTQEDYHMEFRKWLKHNIHIRRKTYELFKYRYGFYDHNMWAQDEFKNTPEHTEAETMEHFGISRPHLLFLQWTYQFIFALSWLFSWLLLCKDIWDIRYNPFWHPSIAIDWEYVKELERIQTESYWRAVGFERLDFIICELWQRLPQNSDPDEMPEDGISDEAARRIVEGILYDQVTIEELDPLMVDKVFEAAMQMYEDLEEKYGDCLWEKQTSDND